MKLNRSGGIRVMNEWNINRLNEFLIDHILYMRSLILWILRIFSSRSSSYEPDSRVANDDDENEQGEEANTITVNTSSRRVHQNG